MNLIINQRDNSTSVFYNFSGSFRFNFVAEKIIKMENKNYSAAIEVAQSPEEAFSSINKVTKWWSDNLEGHTENLNDEFIIDWSDGNFVAFKIIESVPGKKVRWLVTDSNLNWLADKREWSNTQMDFTISPADGKTRISFTHIGLVPGVECYEMCVKGWDQFFKGSLYELITTGKGQPQLRKKVQM